MWFLYIILGLVVFAFTLAGLKAADVATREAGGMFLLTGIVLSAVALFYVPLGGTPFNEHPALSPALGVVVTLGAAGCAWLVNQIYRLPGTSSDDA